MKYILLFALVHVTTAQLTFKTLSDYVVREYSTNSKLVIKMENDSRQTQFNIQIYSPDQTDDFIQLTNPFIHQGSLVSNKYSVTVFNIYDRPYRSFLISDDLEDIKTYVNSVLLGPLGIPKGTQDLEAWKSSISAGDVPSRLQL
jgi:hypothetical protein